MWKVLTPEPLESTMPQMSRFREALEDACKAVRDRFAEEIL
jgi:hypothetical protein